MKDNIPMLPDKIIDFHVHLFPDRLLDSIWRYFSDVYQWKVRYHMYYRDCVDHLRQKGVVRIVYSNYAHKAGIAEGLNNWNLKILDEFDELFCFAAFHPEDQNALDIADKVLGHPKVLGIKLQLLVQNFYPDDKRLFPLYEMIMEKNKRLLFHVGTGPSGNKYVGIKNFKKLLTQYPALPVNVAHMGGFEYREFFDLLPNYELLFFDTSFSFLPKMNLMFNLGNQCLEWYKDKILYGSDFPNLIYPRSDEINCLKNLNLSQEFYQNVFYKNGQQLIDSITK
ncbi:MAG: amidohydrolase family protein [Desulfobacteraceae bacterium]|nr:amidohydrolase family protein [Desulfobacteraceae bacterium]MBC2756492.1 amidohydrolase family protein [Desulfobacteraceae bacterium]